MAERNLTVDHVTIWSWVQVCQERPGIATASDDIPDSGISLPDGAYLVHSAGTDQSEPHGNDYSDRLTC
jgi:hypothetical protein